ncbi:MAG: DUF362 domain-containing protein [bacterium]
MNKNQPPKVVSADASYEDLSPALEKVVEELDLSSRLSELRGKKVFIKPNMLGAFPPEKHVTTWPALVTLTVRLFRDAGAEVVVGDNCGVGGYGLNQRVANKTGIAEASEGAYENVARDTVQVDFDSRYMDSIVVSRAMLEADYLISLPKMKTHGLTLVTGAVKNMFGLVAGAGKGRAHAGAPGNKDFGRILSDIFSIRPPDLTIMDAITAMEGNGPSSGKPKQVNKLLASTNAVALDTIMCRMMGVPATEVHHIRYASQRGHGPVEPERIELWGEAPPIRFKLPVTVHRLSCVGRFINQRFFQPLSHSKLVLDKEKCRKCKLCVDGCPTGAMTMEEYPVVNDELCIRCLCCQELCPESAWQVKGFFGRYFSRG